MIRRKLLAALAILACVAIAACEPATAAVFQTGDVTPDSPVSSYLTVNNTVVQKVLVAQAVGTVAHQFGQMIQEDGAAVLSQQWFIGLALTIGVMITSYLGIWKPALDPNRTLPTVT